MSARSHRQPEISVVIPTRNRPLDLARLLDTLVTQSRLPDEVIVVDASDAPAPNAAALRRLRPISARILRTSPGLCAQRNLGIRTAHGEFILLADDDIEFPPAYIETLAEYLSAHPGEGAVSGTLEESGTDGTIVPDTAPLTRRHIVWRFLFQQTVWGDISGLERDRWLRPLHRFYRLRGNTLSVAGWPLLTDARGPSFRTSVYGLGSAMVRRSWLLASPFDESLHSSGIGDNFGVAMGFPGTLPIVVLTSIRAKHHRSRSHRITADQSFVLRVLALEHFMRRNDRFSMINRLALRWSVGGNILAHAFAGNIRGTRGALKALFKLFWQPPAVM
ncbi:MAG: glycosyltransferase family A protein [Bacteroidota bacterium]